MPYDIRAVHDGKVGCNTAAIWLSCILIGCFLWHGIDWMKYQNTRFHFPAYVSVLFQHIPAFLGELSYNMPQRISEIMLKIKKKTWLARVVSLFCRLHELHGFFGFEFWLAQSFMHLLCLVKCKLRFRFGFVLTASLLERLVINGGLTEVEMSWFLAIFDILVQFCQQTYAQNFLLKRAAFSLTWNISQVQ